MQDSLFGFVIVANTGIGIIQELRRKKPLDGLAVIGEAKPTVRRDGVAAELSTSPRSSSATSSSWAPATRSSSTARVAEADSLEIDESLLTGEADPVVEGTRRPP
ncbi:HAD-IC family P-type ATPase [Streptomyces tanashiensis]